VHSQQHGTANFRSQQNSALTTQAEDFFMKTRWGCPNISLIASQLVASPVLCDSDVLLCCFQESPEACAERSSAVRFGSAETGW
jgi:hypothetical protein